MPSLSCPNIEQNIQTTGDFYPDIITFNFEWRKIDTLSKEFSKLE